MIRRAAVITAALFASLILVTLSCSTDVELAAPYKSTPVIIGSLDLTADTQFFRINRTFLVDGDPTVSAGIRDSIEYADGEVDAWLIKYNGNNIVDSIQLLPIDLPSRDPGIFYDTNVRFYYTDQPLLTADEISNILNMSYEMRATLRGVTYRARTDFPQVLLGDITNPNFTLEPVRRAFVINGVPVTGPFVFTTRPTGGRYQGTLDLVYDEELEDGTITPNKRLSFPLGSFINQEGVTASRDLNFSTGNWYTFVGNYFREVPNLKKVRIHRLDHRLTVANRDLNSYIAVSRPVSQFVPVFTTFSNFDNGAIGILGAINGLSRETWLNEPSLNYLSNSEASSGPCYCVYWTGTAFTCDQSASGCP